MIESLPTSTNLPIEIGVVIAGTLDHVDQAAVDQATKLVANELESLFEASRIHFLFHRIHRAELTTGSRAEPSMLLRQAESERDARHWDFALVVTSAELLGKYSASSCFAALSRPFDAAVFSTSLIDPQATGETIGDDREAVIARRLSRLMLHSIGHLTGLPNLDNPRRIMHRPQSAEQLDHMNELTNEERIRQQTAMLEIADQRLEEADGRMYGTVEFFAKALWINRLEVFEAVMAARPWQFPRRLSGLTIASVSTLLILLMTAEAWDLALSQNSESIILMTLSILLATTGFVAARQQLFIRRTQTRSEQKVVTSASAVAIVAVGMTTTWVSLVAIGTLITATLFSSELIAGWAATSDITTSRTNWIHRLMMSCFSSSLGILIGALGASFESQNYFQHVIFVDEEI